LIISPLNSSLSHSQRLARDRHDRRIRRHRRVLQAARARWEKTGHALGIVYSMTSGNVSNFGTMCKPLHAGLAARNAVEAALWAKSGFTSLPHPFDGPRSFHEVYSRGVPADMKPLEELGREYELVMRGVVIKPYPCGVALHPAIDAVHALKRKAPIDADDIDSIEAGVTKYTFDKLCYLVPDTGLEAKFSMPYTIARSILDDSIGFDTFTDVFVRDERARILTRRVRMYTHDGIEKSWKMGSRPVHVGIRFRDSPTEKIILLGARNGLRRLG
jgi:2-methylcitrate dehydratase PrpD